MKGDIIVLEEHHIAAAKEIVPDVLEKVSYQPLKRVGFLVRPA